MYKNYEGIAAEYCERYGIVEYRVKSNMLIYNVSYNAYLNNPRYTIQHRVNLDTFVSTSKKLGKFDRKGLYNR